MRPLKRSRGSPSIGETDARRGSTGKHSTPSHTRDQSEGSSSQPTHPRSDARRESSSTRRTPPYTSHRRESSSSHRDHHRSDRQRQSPPSSHSTPTVQSSGRESTQTPPVLHRIRKPGWMLLSPYTDPCQRKRPRTRPPTSQHIFSPHALVDPDHLAAYQAYKRNTTEET